MNRTRALIYLTLILGSMMYRAYLKDTVGMMISMLLVPIALYSVVNAKD